MVRPTEKYPATVLFGSNMPKSQQGVQPQAMALETRESEFMEGSGESQAIQAGGPTGAAVAEGKSTLLEAFSKT